MSERLQPCPFCGADCACHQYSEGRDKWFVAYCVGQTDDYATEVEAEAAWNNRVAAPVPDAERAEYERLRSALERAATDYGSAAWGSPKESDLLTETQIARAALDAFVLLLLQPAAPTNPAAVSSELVGQPAAQPHPDNPGRTHWDGCWRERGHHNCAVAEIECLLDKNLHTSAQVQTVSHTALPESTVVSGTAQQDALRTAVEKAVRLTFNACWQAEGFDAPPIDWDVDGNEIVRAALADTEAT